MGRSAALFIEEVTQHHAACCSMKLREPLCLYSLAQPFPILSLLAQIFWQLLTFRGPFGRHFHVQNRSCLLLLEILICILSNDSKIARIGARMRELWLLEASVFEQLFSAFLVKIPAKLEMLLANWDTLVVDELTLFLKGLELRINLQWVWKILHAKAASQVEKVSDFQHNILTFVNFSTHSWRSFRCRFSMILVSKLMIYNYKCHKSCEELSLGSKLQPWEWRWFSWWRVICQSIFWPNRRSSWRFETHKS